MLSATPPRQRRHEQQMVNREQSFLATKDAPLTLDHSRSITASGVPRGNSPKRTLVVNKMSSMHWTSSGVAQVSAMVRLRKKDTVKQMHI
jgi:hypothetical protein